MRFFLLVLFVLLVHNGYSQSFKTDTTFLVEAKKNALALYSNQMRTQSHLINGSRYTGPQPTGRHNLSAKEHPYYAPGWLPGTVLYDNEWYSAAFLYNVSTHTLITNYGPEQIQLISEKIDQFTLEDHHFVKLNEDQLPHTFYEITYNVASKVYVLWQKVVESKYKDNRITSEFIPKTTYYIKKNHTYYVVRGKRSLLKIFPGHKADLKKIIQSKNQVYSDNRIFFISEMARIYDSSSH